MKSPKDIDKEYFIQICKESISMAEAARKLELHYESFKRYAIKYDCYITNQCGRGIKKNIGPRKNDLSEYKTRVGVRTRILKEGLLEYKCSVCGIDAWLGKELSLHLDHINGVPDDHRLENLRFLCPNCHSQTDTYTGRNKNK